MLPLPFLNLYHIEMEAGVPFMLLAKRSPLPSSSVFVISRKAQLFGSAALMASAFMRPVVIVPLADMEPNTEDDTIFTDLVLSVSAGTSSEMNICGVLSTILANAPVQLINECHPLGSSDVVVPLEAVAVCQSSKSPP